MPGDGNRISSDEHVGAGESAYAETVLGRRRFLQASLVAGAGLAAATALPPFPAGAAGLCDFGAGCEPRAGEENQREAVRHLERKIGRKLGIMRRYTFWDADVPDGTHIWAAERGSTPYIAWHAYTRSRRAIPWRSIAQGDHDDHLSKTATALRNMDRTVYFNFHHEPENDPRNGDAPQFVAAWNRVRQVFDDAGADNLVWICTLMASTYNGGHGGAGRWLPERFDMFGVDGYNRWPCDRGFPWRGFREIFAPSRKLARRWNKPLFIGEYGCTERTDCGGSGSNTAKADWLRKAHDTVRGWPEVSGLVYSHGKSDSGIPYWADSSRASMRAFRSMANSSRYRG
jgi:hypothetical protein